MNMNVFFYYIEAIHIPVQDKLRFNSISICLKVHFVLGTNIYHRKNTSLFFSNHSLMKECIMECSCLNVYTQALF